MDDVIIIGDDGTEHVFPAGFDPKKAAAIVRGMATPETTPAQDRAALFGGPAENPVPPRPSLSEQMRDRPLMDRVTHPIPDTLTDPETGQPIRVMGSPGIIQAAATSGVNLPGAVKGIPGVLAKGLGISKARAGANIAEAVTAAKDVPLNVATSIEQPLAEIMRFKGIERLPMAVRSLAKELQSGAPLTVETARKYYPAISRMSASEFATLTPNMQRLVGGLRAAMNTGITDAAETVGKGAQYASGMREYARAGKAAKLAKRAAQVSGVAGGGYAAAGWLKSLLADTVSGR